MWVPGPSSFSPPSWLHAHVTIQINEVKMIADGDLNTSIFPVVPLSFFLLRYLRGRPRAREDWPGHSVCTDGSENFLPELSAWPHPPSWPHLID